MSLSRVAVAGSVLTDRICSISAYPKAGELTHIRSISRVTGGCVPNTGIDIRRLAPYIPVAALGRVGEDDDGRFVRTVLEREGLDASGLVCAPSAQTSFTDVMSVAGGERTFFTFPGASAEWGYDDIDFDAVGPDTLFHLGYFLLLDRIDRGDGLKILRELKARGATTSIDLVTENSDRYSLVRECLPYVDDLVVNEMEAARMAGLPDDAPLKASAEALRALGVRDRVVIHRPDEGACLSSEGFTLVPSFALPDGFVQGTTGAGDAFCAGALVSILRGSSDAELLEFASMAAVAALSAPGATDGMRNEASVRALCAQFSRKR